MKEVKIGIVGFGTVGAGVADILLNNNDIIAKRAGVKLKLHAIADRDITSDRGVNVPREMLTRNVDQVIHECDVLVELVGGTTFAGDFILKALKAGKPVVTANKALLAHRGKELFQAAEAAGTELWYEASVAGGIPIIKALREGLVANRINGIYGIMNGTCNYILTRMEREGASFEDVLSDAQKLGYAEADPSLDIDGFDTAHKTSILASLAYGKWFGADPVHVEGLRGVTPLDLKFADELGYRIKLLGIIKNIDGAVQMRVHPTLIPKNTMLANISDVFNGVMVEGDRVGQTLFYGRGAGRFATASAVVADLTDVALNIAHGSVNRVPAFRSGEQFNSLQPISQLISRYYLRLSVDDRPGVLAAISKILSERSISISSLVQRESSGSDGSHVPLLILTHEAQEAALNAAIADIEKLPVVSGKVRIFRIEDI